MRFFAFGCSYTRYNYPTWADILGRSFPEYYNLGKIGAGNSYIFGAVNEADFLYNFGESDTVAICWANFLREDRFHSGLGWHCPGNVLHHLQHNPLYLNNFQYRSDQEWADIVHCFLRDIALIRSCRAFLKSKGVRTVFFSVYDIYNDPAFGDLQCKEIQGLLGRVPAIEDLVTITKKYGADLFDVPAVNSSITYDESEKRFYHLQQGQPVKEDHPLPLEHLYYVEKYIAQFLNVTVDCSTSDWTGTWQNRLISQHYVEYPVHDWEQEIKTCALISS